MCLTLRLIKLLILMSTPQIVNAGNDPASLNPSVSMETKVTHDVGVIESASALHSDVDSSRPRVSQQMPTNTLDEFLTRFVEIETLTFSNTNSAAVAFSTFEPWFQWLINPWVTDKTKNYSLIRGTMEVMFVSAFPGNCHGSFTVTAYPYGGCAENIVATSYSDTMTFATCMQTDHCTRVDVANAENVVLRLPFLWSYDYADISRLRSSTYRTPWLIKMWSLAPVGTAIPGGVTSGSIQVYARLTDDYELCVPILQGKKRNVNEGASSVISKVAPGLDKYKGKISGMADMITGVTSKLEGIPIIGPYASVATGIVDKIGDVASWFGFTREDAEEAPLSFNGRPFSNTAHIDSKDTSDTTSLSLTNAISIDPMINGLTSSADPCAYESLFERWTLIQQATWAPAAVAGSTIASLYVTPFYGLGAAGAELTTINLTTAGYVGLPFNYWRGDMEYLIVIPVSKLHRGTIQIYWVPFGSSSATYPASTTLNMIYDVSTDDEKQFVVGYARDAPYLRRVVFCPSTTTIAPQGYTNGQLVFRVVNPLQSQSSVDSVTISIFARGAKNMDFAMLGDHVDIVATTGLLSASMMGQTFTYQGASGDGEDEETDVTEVLVPPSGEYPSEQINFGERIRSVRALLQKFYYFGYGFCSNQAPTYILTAAHVAAFQSGIAVSFDFRTHYGLMYHGLAASCRYKLMGALPQELYAAFPSVPPLTGATAGVIDTIGPLACYQTAAFSGAEFKIPYYSNLKFMTTRSQYTNAYAAPLIDNLVHVTLEGATVEFPRVWSAYGPDIRPNMFNHVPQMIIDSSLPPAAPPGGMV